MAHPLVYGENGAERNGPAEVRERWDPAFYSYGRRLLPTGLYTRQERALLEHLIRRLNRQPRDLLTHVRRVLLARKLRDPEMTFAACEALFAILGEKGKGLRTHLLRLCAPVLGSERRGRLELIAQSHEPGGMDFLLPSHPIVRFEHARDFSSSMQIMSAVEEATQYLESGQVSEARACLEDHLQLEPADAEAHRLLLEIYRRAQDGEALRAMRARLEARENLPPPLAALWHETEKAIVGR